MMWQQERSSHGSLIDILDKVLDKGLVVAGDIRISLANVELLTIKIRLLVCSIDKAQEIGLDWWRHDAFLSSRSEEMAGLRERIEALEQQLILPAQPGTAPLSSGSPKRRPRRRKPE